MDQQGKAASFAAKSGPRTFSEAEYSANPGKVIAHAAATGTAVVSASDGSPRVVISIPTVDLPILGD
jgi:hypothetical protein